MLNSKLTIKKQSQKSHSRIILSTTSQNTSVINGQLKEIQEKPNIQYTDSPYAKVVSKIRSQSQFKNKSISSCFNSYVGSPIFSASPNVTISSKKLSLKNVLNNKTASISDLKKIQTKHKIKPPNIGDVIINYEQEPSSYCYCQLEAIKFEKKLVEIEKLRKCTGVNFEIFELYKEVFAEIIGKDRAFSKVLGKIKSVYEEWIKIKIGYVAENTQLKYELINISKTVKELKDQNDALVISVKKISEENVKLGRENDLKDQQYRSLQEHLIKISNIRRDDYPQTEEAWKLIIAENKTYSEVCECMKKDIHNLKKNERRLLKLIDLVRDEGFPVDELYQNKIKRTKSPKDEEARPVQSEDEEYINTTPARKHDRPNNVPMLNLEIIPPVPATAYESSNTSSLPYT